MMQLSKAAVGLGANVGDKARTLAEAARAVCEDIFQNGRISSFYESNAWPDASDPRFWNVVVVGDTDWNAEAILNYALDLERAYGRVRGAKNAPRTLDVDLLLHGDRSVRSELLQVPHPRIAERDFVLFPLAEVAPDWIVPGKGTVAALAETLRSRAPNDAKVVAPPPAAEDVLHS